MGPMLLERKNGSLNLVDPIETTQALLSKWVVHVLESRNSNL